MVDVLCELIIDIKSNKRHKYTRGFDREQSDNQVKSVEGLKNDRFETMTKNVSTK